VTPVELKITEPGYMFDRINVTSSAGDRRVNTVTIDKLVSEGAILPPRCIKIDVEGAEVLVLSGAEAVLETYGPTIFLATHGHRVHQEACELLKSLGYKLQSIGGKSIEETDELIATAR